MAAADVSIRTTSESVGKDRMRLRVEVPEQRFEPAIAAVYKRLAGEISIPGFRKGKVPRQMIDARVGTDAVREEALRDALPDLYQEALDAEGLQPIAAPEVDVVEFEAGAPLVFEATVDVRPEIAIPDLASLTVQAPPSEVTDEDIDEQLERLRDRFAELETVGREARRGDFALIDLKGYRHEELVEGAGAPDFLYEIGSHTGPPKLDEELEGNRPGAILKFTDTLPPTAGDLAGEEVSFTVLLKEVKAKRLPVLDDGFAKTVGEFDTLEDLRSDLRERLGDVKRSMVEDEIRSLCLAALVDAAGFDAPESLVDRESEHRLEHFQDDLRRTGLTLDEYSRRAGVTELQIRGDLRTQAERSVKAELLLEEIARENEVDVSQEDIGREIALAAAQTQEDPKELAQRVIREGHLSSLAADIMRRKALDIVVGTMDVVGRPQEATVESRDDQSEAAS